MPDVSPLSDAALAEVMAALPNWERRGDALVRTVELDDFPAAMAFLVRVGFVAEQHGHHPEITNVYTRVTLRLTTHDAGNRITENDVALARALDRLAF